MCIIHNNGFFGNDTDDAILNIGRLVDIEPSGWFRSTRQKRLSGYRLISASVTVLRNLMPKLYPVFC